MQVIESSNGGGADPPLLNCCTLPGVHLVGCGAGGERRRRRRVASVGNGGCKRRAAEATVEIALLVHACGQSALGARPRARAATGASMEPVPSPLRRRTAALSSPPTPGYRTVQGG